jgi:hypothetical protein
VVIGDRFAWAHLQKTGGSATHAMFGLFPELVEFADPLGADNASHVTFPARGEEIRDKVLAMNIRRLPAYVLSWNQALIAPSDRSGHAGRTMRSPHEMSRTWQPDRRLAKFTGEGRFAIERWIRTEHLADDFLDFVSDFIEVDGERAERVREIRLNEQEYDHELDHWFTPKQLEILYRRNPVWGAVEEEVYGSTVLATYLGS